VLLLAGSLLSELTDDFLSEPGGLAEHVIQPIEHLSELIRAEGGSVVRHSFTKDYRGHIRAVKLNRPC